ncbi:efflux RND transporter periplasmic adaptor subunit [Aliiglaciecola lipolytica]|uniref:Membrane-fusion protein n=1 Tax=Aliiglaciecola lipolytica E3 TaxID=1127673 RepID=K6YTH9_9ALTE|nr:efflux RND transporter periplasmic adaptor subunit [Aliiglaciecola lipolytica]GAC14595.1 membrane-fusion protein [Aliiglaciecola lipolytica E3]
MASSTTKILVPLVILALAVVGFIGLLLSKKPPEIVEVEERPFLVNVEPARLETINFKVHSQGTVAPRVETRLSVQVTGKVEWVADSFIEGGMFKQGDVLIQLEKYDYQTEVKLAEAELARAEASLEEEIARGKVAEQEWRSVKGNVAPELGLRKPQLATEKANLSAAKAQLEKALRNLQRTSITAPFDGLVKSKNVDLGQFVSLGSELGVIYSTKVAEVRMPLSDNDMAFMRISNGKIDAPKVTLSAVVAGAKSQWVGKLVRDEGVLDEQRRVIYAVAEIIDPYLRESDSKDSNRVPLKFGRFVQAEIVGQNSENILVLPRNVLRLDGTLLIVDSNNELQIKQVVVKRADEKYVYISQGINEGDLVITSAVPNPFNGMKVRLPDDEEDNNNIQQLDKQVSTSKSVSNAGDAK